MSPSRWGCTATLLRFAARFVPIPPSSALIGVLRRLLGHGTATAPQNDPDRGARCCICLDAAVLGGDAEGAKSVVYKRAQRVPLAVVRLGPPGARALRAGVNRYDAGSDGAEQRVALARRRRVLKPRDQHSEPWDAFGSHASSVYQEVLARRRGVGRRRRTRRDAPRSGGLARLVLA